MRTYKVTVTRDDKWWMIAIPELMGHVGASGATNVGDTTQARRLAEVPAQALDFICTVTDAAPSSVSVEISIEVDGIDVSGRVAKARHDREMADQYGATAAAEVRQLARDLASHGVPVRDVGEVLGVSFQRAQQLITA